jgi:hypothetical protein
MRSVLLATAAAVCALVFGQSAGADDLETLQAIPIAAVNLSVDDSDSHFMVVYERMGETATAAVFAGIIGAGINSAINADQDADLARPYLAAANALPLKDIIEKSIRSTLEDKGMDLADAAEASHVLRVEIRDWGLLRTSFDSTQLTTFLKLHLIMKDGKERVWDVYQKEVGKKPDNIENITPESLSAAMEKLAAKSGKRVAYEIIYR